MSRGRGDLQETLQRRSCGGVHGWMARCLMTSCSPASSSARLRRLDGQSRIAVFAAKDEVESAGSQPLGGASCPFPSGPWSPHIDPAFACVHGLENAAARASPRSCGVTTVLVPGRRTRFDDGWTMPADFGGQVRRIVLFQTPRPAAAGDAYRTLGWTGRWEVQHEGRHQALPLADQPRRRSWNL